MPTSYKIRGIEPADLKAWPASTRKLYWGWVVEFGIQRKDQELAAGLDKSGKPLKPLRPATIKNRRSAMTPTGKGDPSAPPLSPGHHKSRTRSLLAGRATTDGAEFYWRYDAFTGDSWSTVLEYQIAQGRDVFGLSPAGVKWVQTRANARWEAWKAGQYQTNLLGQRKAAAGRQPVEIPTVGSMPSATTTMGIEIGDGSGGPLKPGQFSGLMTAGEWEKHFRAPSRAAVPHRPAPLKLPHSTTGPGNNRLLSHVWGSAPPQGGPPTPGSTLGSSPAPRSPLRAVAGMGGGRKGKQPKPLKPAKPKAPTPPAPPAAPPPPPTPPAPPPTSVSSRFDLTGPNAPKTAGKLAKALQTIDGVHHLGSVSPNPIPITKPDRIKRSSANGAFISNALNGQAVRIEIRDTGKTPSFTLAHEIGHFLELTVIPGHNAGRRMWASDPLMKPFHDAVRQSQSYQELLGFAYQSIIYDQGKQYKVNPRHVTYLTSDVELWARAYAQWIATRSQDPTLLQQLADRRDPAKVPVYYREHWTDSDFQPIAAAMDTIFKSLGWMP